MCPVSRSACAGRRLGGSLILSLIHVRVPRYITGYYRAASRHGDQHGQLWTAILNPEKRKVGGSIRGSATPPGKIDEVRHLPRLWSQRCSKPVRPSRLDSALRLLTSGSVDISASRSVVAGSVKPSAHCWSAAPHPWRPSEMGIRGGHRSWRLRRGGR